METYVRSAFAGMLITIAATIFLMTPNPILGSFFFSIGLLAIVHYGFLLFTGFVGYLPVEIDKFTYAGQCFQVWTWNFFGAVLTGLLIRSTYIYPIIQERVLCLMDFKTSISIQDLIVLGFFCGILMFIATNSWKYGANPVSKIVILILCVMVFINCKFEHCVANMAYFILAVNKQNFLDTAFAVLMTSIGNIFGCCLIPFFNPKLIRV